LGWTRGEVEALLLALQPEDFRKEFGQATTDFGDVFADDYRIWFDDGSFTRCQPLAGMRFYVKVGITKLRDADTCLVISLHLDGRP
jgi:hypothetical protein